MAGMSLRVPTMGIGQNSIYPDAGCLMQELLMQPALGLKAFFLFTQGSPDAVGATLGYKMKRLRRNS